MADGHENRSTPPEARPAEPRRDDLPGGSSATPEGPTLRSAAPGSKGRSIRKPAPDKSPAGEVAPKVRSGWRRRASSKPADSESNPPAASSAPASSTIAPTPAETIAPTPAEETGSAKAETEPALTQAGTEKSSSPADQTDRASGELKAAGAPASGEDGPEAAQSAKAVPGAGKGSAERPEGTGWLTAGAGGPTGAASIFDEILDKPVEQASVAKPAPLWDPFEDRYTNKKYGAGRSAVERLADEKAAKEIAVETTAKANRAARRKSETGAKAKSPETTAGNTQAPTEAAPTEAAPTEAATTASAGTVTKPDATKPDATNPDGSATAPPATEKPGEKAGEQPKAATTPPSASSPDTKAGNRAKPSADGQPAEAPPEAPAAVPSAEPTAITAAPTTAEIPAAEKTTGKATEKATGTAAAKATERTAEEPAEKAAASAGTLKPVPERKASRGRRILRRANPVRAVVVAGRSTSAWARRPSGRLILPALIAVLLVAAAGTAGVYLVPKALKASPSPSATPGFALDDNPAGGSSVAPPSVGVSSAPTVPPLGATTAPPVVGVAQRPADSLAGWAQPVGTRLGIPVVAVEAYAYAELVVAKRTPSCHLSWTTVAAIGDVESDHGSTGGAVLGADGSVQPPIRGLPLDGQGGRQLVKDTDQGTLDGDSTYDRAVGPMQFIPSTWRQYGVDADNNGVADPNDIDDAALTAAVYLCQGGRDLSKADSWWDAILSYNAVQPYAQKVFDAANLYGQRSRV